jgi:hypothetical protein
MMRHGASPRPKSSLDIAATSDPSSSAAEAHRTRENRSGARPPSRAEIRTRDGGAHGNCAHQLSYRFTPSHIKTASSQLASQGAYSCLIHGALDVQTFGSKKVIQKKFEPCSSTSCTRWHVLKENPTIHHCHRVSGKEQKGYIITQAQVFIQ